MSAVWYDADNSGTGWVIERLDGDRATAYWYTFDEDGQPRWAVGAGRLAFTTVSSAFEFPELLAGSGARFGAAFDAQDVDLQNVGSATIRFGNCQEGSLSGEAFGEDIAQPLDRLTQTMAAGCSSRNGIPGQPVQSYAGQSGAWYNPDRSGEGFTLQWMARDEAVVYWFTYDTEGNPYWLFGVGVESDGVIEIAELYAAERDQNGEVNLTTWGSLTLDLVCNDGTLEYNSVLPGFGAGSLPVNRLNELAAPKCPYVAPKLQELYNIDLILLPLSNEEDIEVMSVADDGTVSGVRTLANGNREAVLLPWRAPAWLTVDGQPLAENLPLFISPDAQTLRGTGAEAAGSTTRNFPVDWTSVTGWSMAPGFEGETAQGTFSLRGVSSNFNAFAGQLVPSSEEQDPAAWVFHPDTGLRILPLSDEDANSDINFNGNALDVSNDGRTVIGNQSYPVINVPPFHAAGADALLWKDDNEPQVLRDNEGNRLGSATVCNSDCSIIYGTDSTFERVEDDPRIGQAWYWTEDLAFARLDKLIDDPSRVEPLGVTDDGYLMVGTSSRTNPFPIVTAYRPFLWTQVTGTIDINTLLIDLGLSDESQGSFGGAVSVSNEGRFILLQAGPNQAALVALNPR